MNPRRTTAVGLQGFFEELFPGVAYEKLSGVRESQPGLRVQANRVFAARSAVLYQISTEFAAKQQVDMERSRNDMEEHLSVCSFAAEVRI